MHRYPGRKDYYQNSVSVMSCRGKLSDRRKPVCSGLVTAIIRLNGEFVLCHDLDFDRGDG